MKERTDSNRAEHDETGTSNARTVWELARIAECSDPDTDSSPGADFLRHVENSVKEALAYGHEQDYDVTDEDWQSSTASEVADQCVPVYTHNLWVTFVDLAAYSEDVSELGMESVPTDELEKLPSLALYMIGERLALALFSEELAEDGGTE
jgi:hypothetical protein